MFGNSERLFDIQRLLICLDDILLASVPVQQLKLIILGAQHSPTFYLA